MLKEFLELVKACGNDVTLNKYKNGKYELTYNDFLGFTDDGDEEYREYDNELAVDTLQQWLENNCTYYNDDYYTIYIFNDFKVIAGYLSFDI